TLLAASTSSCVTKALSVSSTMSSPRPISELTITPLYQYTDQVPALPIVVESAGPRSKNAISLGCAASVQSNTEMPPWYHDCTMTSRPGIGINEPLCATQFSRAV